MKHFIFYTITVLFCLAFSASSQVSPLRYLVEPVAEYPALIEQLQIKQDRLSQQCRRTIAKHTKPTDDSQAMYHSLPSCQQARLCEIKMERARSEFKARLCQERK